MRRSATYVRASADDRINSQTFDYRLDLSRLQKREGLMRHIVIPPPEGALTDWFRLLQVSGVQVLRTYKVYLGSLNEHTLR